MIIPERQSWVIQRLGKFNRISRPGLKLKIPVLESIASKENLRIQQLDVDVETKTLDDVFVILKISVQYRVIGSKVYEAFYELDDPHGQIASYIFDEVRAEVPKLGLDDVFGKKDDIALAVRDNISSQMDQYGYKIVKTLITDINPDELVKASMNKINAATRDKEAAVQEAEAEKIRIVKKAEAEADSKRLSGEGIAQQRLEIVRGFKESVEDFQKALQDVDPQEIMQFVLMTQYFDTLTAIGANENNNTVMVTDDPATTEDETASACRLPSILRIMANEGNDYRIAMAAQIEQALGSIGVATDGDAKPWAEYLDMYYTGTFEIRFSGWAPDYLDPDNYWSPFAASSEDVYGTGYHNAALDALLQDAKVSTDDTGLLLPFFPTLE